METEGHSRPHLREQQEGWRENDRRELNAAEMFNNTGSPERYDQALPEECFGEDRESWGSKR